MWFWYLYLIWEFFMILESTCHLIKLLQMTLCLQQVSHPFSPEEIAPPPNKQNQGTCLTGVIFCFGYLFVCIYFTTSQHWGEGNCGISQMWPQQYLNPTSMKKMLFQNLLTPHDKVNEVICFSLEPVRLVITKTKKWCYMTAQLKRTQLLPRSLSAW